MKGCLVEQEKRVSTEDILTRITERELQWQRREPDESGTPLVIRLFGPLEVWRNGQPLPRLRSRKGLWLLALLALRAGRPVDRDWLAGTLWLDHDEAHASRNLRQNLHDLRRALGPEAGRLCSPIRTRSPWI